MSSECGSCLEAKKSSEPTQENGRTPLVIRYQMGPYPVPGSQWDCLELAMVLMRRLEPEADVHCFHQGDLHQGVAERCNWVNWHFQDMGGRPYFYGRHEPLKVDLDSHEIYCDSDHIVWELPPGWIRFKARTDAVLVWRIDWNYFASYADEIAEARGSNWKASAGHWGVPPGVQMPYPVIRVATDQNQDEMGAVVAWLARQPEHEYVWESTEVPVYNPKHNAILGRDKVGSHGVHLMGLGRGWNAEGEELLRELRRKYL